ncbi:MAG: hypothetical protein K9H16_11540 [Bacteroidales bacterium]|nr:hypothetical protein [Bacteroidales bacterium]
MKKYLQKSDYSGLVKRMIEKVNTMLILLFVPLLINGQAAVTSDGSAPDASAILTVKSTEKGFLPPRLTTIQRDAISTPAEGLVIYNTDHKALEMFNGSLWGPLSGGFRCGASQITDNDGHIYNTTLIGNQCWLAENLNSGAMIDMASNPSDNDLAEKYCYDNTASNCNEYGGLYKWDELMDYQNEEGVQGICPTGWHVPATAEWLTMVNYLGGWVDAANKLKEAGTQHWGTGNLGTNSSGFTAIPCGFLYLNSIWYNTYNAWFFTSTENAGNTSWAGVYYINGLDPEESQVNFSQDYKKDNAMSVRCIKNQ